jgi:hypothetical protein
MVPVTGEPTFGDRVRVKASQETTELGFAGRVGQVYGETVPSLSGVGPAIGDRGDDPAVSVVFEDTAEQAWFATHLVEFVDREGPCRLVLDGGPTFVRDGDTGEWHELGWGEPLGDVSPRRRVPRVLRGARTRLADRLRARRHSD